MGSGMHRPSAQERQKFEALHAQARSKALAALTPAHRALLSQVVGGLAVASDPDYRAAARRIDDALSASEKTQVLGVRDELRKEMTAMMGSNRPQGGPPGHPMGHGSRMNDPGAFLLMLSSHPMGGPPPHP